MRNNAFIRSFLVASALVLALTTGCARTDDVDTAETRQGPPVVFVTPTALSTSTQTEAPETDASECVMQAAEVYRSLYESAFTGDGVTFSLSADDMENILERLGSQGYAAIDSTEDFPMRNAALVTAFFDDMDSSLDAELSIFEICPDAGILCHTLRVSGSGCFVTRTRLAWLSDGSMPLHGMIPTVTYSNTYEVTELCLSDGILYYTYDMPDNPSGSNHDGHIDTAVTFALGK